MNAMLASIISVIIFLPLHEFGHYLASLLFGFAPRLVRERDAVGVAYDCENDGNEWKMRVIAFSGIIGTIPVVVVCRYYPNPYNIFVSGFLIGYSFYELIKRSIAIKRSKK